MEEIVNVGGDDWNNNNESVDSKVYEVEKTDPAKLNNLSKVLKSLGNNNALEAARQAPIKVINVEWIHPSSIPWQARIARFFQRLLGREIAIDALNAKVETAGNFINELSERLRQYYNVDVQVRDSSQWFLATPFDLNDLTTDESGWLAGQKEEVKGHLEALVQAESAVTSSRIQDPQLNRVRELLEKQLRLVNQLLDIQTAGDGAVTNVANETHNDLQKLLPVQYGRAIAQRFDREFNRLYSHHLGGRVDPRHLLKVRDIYSREFLHNQMRALNHSHTASKRYVDSILKYLHRDEAFNERRNTLDAHFRQLFVSSLGGGTSVYSQAWRQESLGVQDPIRRRQIAERVATLYGIDHSSEEEYAEIVEFHLTRTIGQRIDGLLENNVHANGMGGQIAATRATEYLATEAAVLQRLAYWGIDSNLRLHLNRRLVELDRLSDPRELEKIAPLTLSSYEKRAFTQKLRKARFKGQQLALSATARYLLKTQFVGGGRGEEIIDAFFGQLSDRSLREEHLAYVFATGRREVVSITFKDTIVQRDKIAQPYEGSDTVPFITRKWIALYALWEKGELKVEDLENFNRALLTSSRLNRAAGRQEMARHRKAFNLMVDALFIGILETEGMGKRFGIFDILQKSDPSLENKLHLAKTISGLKDEDLDVNIGILIEYALTQAERSGQQHAYIYKEQAGEKAKKELQLQMAVGAAAYPGLFATHFDGLEENDPAYVAAKKRAGFLPKSRLAVALTRDLRGVPRKLLGQRAAKAVIDFATDEVGKFLAEERTIEERNQLLMNIHLPVVEAAADFIGLTGEEKNRLIKVTRESITTLNRTVVRETDLLSSAPIESTESTERGEKTQDRRKVILEMQETEKSFLTGFTPLYTLIESPGYKQRRNELAKDAKVSLTHLDQVETQIKRTYAAITKFNAQVQAIKIADDEDGVEDAIDKLTSLMRSNETTTYFSALTEFTTIMPRADEILNAMQDAGIDDSWFGEITDSNESSVNVGRRTIQPAQRLPRWQLLLGDLLKKPGHDTKVNGATQSAFATVKGAAANINELLRVIDDFGKLN